MLFFKVLYYSPKSLSTLFSVTFLKFTARHYCVTYAKVIAFSMKCKFVYVYLFICEKSVK